MHDTPNISDAEHEDDAEEDRLADELRWRREYINEIRQIQGHADVLAKALYQFFQNITPPPWDWMAAARALQTTVEPTLRALGYPKEENKCH